MIKCVSTIDFIETRHQNKLIEAKELREYLVSLNIVKNSIQNRIITYYELGVKENKRKEQLKNAFENVSIVDKEEVIRHILSWNAKINN